MSINYIDLLPDEIVFLVFKKLDCVASCRFAQTSKRFYHLIRASLEHTLIRCPLEWGLSVQIRMLNLAVEDEAPLYWTKNKFIACNHLVLNT